MRKFFAIVKNELYRYFVSPLAYVYLIAFLFLNASFTFYLGHFIEREQASLNVMFGFIPWIYLIFISGIAMRLWSEEFKSKTITQLLTLPISLSQAVWGKYIAAWILCGIALLLTLTFAATVNFLGTPDNLVIFSGYLASLLLAGAMLAVAQTMSALTDNQVIALILAVIANLFFFLGGMEYVLQFYRSFLPFSVVESLAQLSFLTNFYTMSSGVIGLSNILFFISVIVLFNFLTEVILRLKTSNSSFLYAAHRRFFDVIFILLLWLGFAGFNTLINHSFKLQKLDMTQNQIYTLPQAARHILQNVKEPVTVKVYYSPVLSQRNPLFRQGIEYLQTLLKTYQQEADNKFSYRIYYPQFLNNEEDMALHDHMTPIPLPDINQTAFFGISLVDEGGKQKSIPLVPLENLERIGFDILQSIYEFSHDMPTVGVLTSLPIFGLETKQNQVGSAWQVIEEIQKLYKIKVIKESQDLKNIDVLVLMHPKELSPDMVKALETYTLQGGKILLLLDIAHEAQRLYSPMNQRLTPSMLSGLDNLWGFRFNPDSVIADLDNSLTVNTGSKTHASFAQDVIQFILKGRSINRQQLETRNLGSLLFASATAIIPEEKRDVTFIPLLKTSDHAALMPSRVVYDNINPADILAQFRSDDTSKIVAAKIISHHSPHPFTVIVIGDTDWLYDDFWSQFKMLEEHKYLVYLNDNLNFFMNALDSLSGHTELIDLRKNASLTPVFENWEKLRKQNAQVFSLKEREVFQKINEIKEQLNNLWQKKNFEERQDFSDNDLTVLAQFRQSLQTYKQQLSDLRLNQNANLESKGRWIVFLNLYAIPCFIIFCLLLVLLHRRSPTKYAFSTQPYFQKKIFFISGFCLLLFGGACLTIFTDISSHNNHENEVIFPDWQKQLNQIQSIVLKHQQDTLTFYKKDGLWALKGYEDYPIYQRRIINLLASLANARYLEKKSARAEYLPQFGLDSNSATSIALYDENGSTLLQFDIGNYDEEIGRGGRGAYLKFPNRFQVWLISADFISLSTDWRHWVMNNALDLRFGRVLQTDKEMSDDVLILLLKELFITPLTIVNARPEIFESVGNIHLIFENQDDLTLYFEKAGDKNYIRYVFGKTETDYLKLFAQYAKDRLYEIPAKNMEKIEDVFLSLR